MGWDGSWVGLVILLRTSVCGENVVCTLQFSHHFLCIRYLNVATEASVVTARPNDARVLMGRNSGDGAVGS